MNSLLTRNQITWLIREYKIREDEGWIRDIDPDRYFRRLETRRAEIGMKERHIKTCLHRLEIGIPLECEDGSRFDRNGEIVTECAA